MTHKLLLGSAVAAALLFGANTASACAISAWSSATGLTVADTGEPTAGFKRYSGRCGLRVNAGAKFVQDNTPADVDSYRVRFYYFTGNITGATADIFQARNTAGTNIIRVTHDGAQLQVYANGVASPASITVNDNAYYSIELNWAAATTAGGNNGSLSGTVRGAGALGSGAPTGTVNFASISNGADRITDARIGLINAPAGLTVTAPVFFDEFDSRRTTSPGRLVRGDANGNGTVTATDAVAILNETAGSSISVGQPDCNENGTITSTDAVCVLNITANGD